MGGGGLGSIVDTMASIYIYNVYIVYLDCIFRCTKLTTTVTFGVYVVPPFN